MTESDSPAILPLPTGTRRLLLDFLAAVYPAHSAQTRLGNQPDAAIAWQAQSALDDFADHAAFVVAANDNFGAVNDNVAFRDVA